MSPFQQDERDDQRRGEPVGQNHEELHAGQPIYVVRDLDMAQELGDVPIVFQQVKYTYKETKGGILPERQRAEC